MPRGRPVNFEKRITYLVAQLKAALVGRSRQRIESHVDDRVATLVGGLQGVVEADGIPAARDVAAPAPASVKGTGRRPRSAASRALQAAKMKAYWAKRKAGKGSKAAVSKTKRAPRTAAKRGPKKGNAKLKSAWAKYTPAQRAARIAAMRAGHAKRKRKGGKMGAAEAIVPRTVVS